MVIAKNTREMEITRGERVTTQCIRRGRNYKVYTYEYYYNRLDPRTMLTEDEYNVLKLANLIEG
jgi:hypothetical protein